MAARGAAAAVRFAAGLRVAAFALSLTRHGGVRSYFTPAEVARLHGFPASFAFPAHVTTLQRYALLGNSLSCHVVAPLLTHLLADL